MAAVYDTKTKMNRPGQNPDILELAEIVDQIRNRMVELHKSVQAFDDQLHIRCGDAQISLYQNGGILISGTDVQIHSTGEIEAKANGRLRLKGSRVQQN